MPREEWEKRRKENGECINIIDNADGDDVERVENWRQEILEKLEKSENEILKKITPEFKHDHELKSKIETFMEKNVSEGHDLSFDKDYESLIAQLYDYSFQIKQKIMDNQCFIILDKKRANDSQYCLRERHICNHILPIIQINEWFIGKKKPRYTEVIYTENAWRKLVNNVNEESTNEPEIALPVQSLIPRHEIREWLSYDEHDAGYPIYNDREIINEVRR